MLALPLLMTFRDTNNVQPSLSAYDAAIFATLSDRCTYLHIFSLV
jgi:hypothetical protein